MELSLLLLKKILSMMLMMLMGYAIVKLGGVKKGQTHVLSALMLYLIYPCLMLHSFQLEYNSERLVGLLVVTVAAIVLHAVYIVLTKIIGDRLRLDNVERASLIYTTGGNLIVPLVSSLLGREYVFYCCAFMAVQAILVWTHMAKLLRPGTKVSVKKVLLNPNILGIAAGLLCFFLRVTFPPIIADTLSAVSDTIGPIAMFMIGMLMAEVDSPATFSNGRNYLVCFGRLIFYPLVLVLLIWASRVTFLVPGAREQLVVTVLAGCAPIAVSVTQMSDVFGADSVKASALNVMSVIFCIITMPLIIAFYQWVC